MEIILGRFKNNKVFICAFLTACYTGMRTGEVFALTWNDIDLDNRIIKVNKTVYAKDKEENGRWYLGTTKTIGSSREVYICDTLYSVLSDYKNLQVKYKKEYCKKYKRYTLKEIKNKYGKFFVCYKFHNSYVFKLCIKVYSQSLFFLQCKDRKVISEKRIFTLVNIG